MHPISIRARPWRAARAPSKEPVLQRLAAMALLSLFVAACGDEEEEAIAEREADLEWLSSVAPAASDV